jgi:hypothetical protein
MPAANRERWLPAGDLPKTRQYAGEPPALQTDFRGTGFYFAENDRTVVLLKVSPGRRMVEGKLV